MRAVKTRQPVVIHFYSFFGLSKKHCCPCSVVLHAPVQLGSHGGVTMQPQTVGRLPPVVSYRSDDQKSFRENILNLCVGIFKSCRCMCQSSYHINSVRL